MAVDGLSLAVAGTGMVFVYAGIKGKSILATFQSVLVGKSPTTVPESNPISGSLGSATVNQTTPNDTAIGAASGGTKVPGAVTSIQNYGLAQAVASTYGWAGGTEFAALTNVIQAESGGNPNAANPSGAYGIAQALGHGTSSTQGSVTNQYGGYGVPDATCVQANSGDAQAQLIWMMAYIQNRWHDPIGAWANEQSAHWY